MSGRDKSAQASRAAEGAARESYGRLIAILAAQDRDIAAADDALSEALAAALKAWPLQGVPAKPEGWLPTTARNVRRNIARGSASRERAAPGILRRFEEIGEGEEPSLLSDERLRLMFACARPAIDPGARSALILQTVLGIDAARIARAFLLAPATMSQRLVRARARIRDAGLAFSLPGPEDLAPRQKAVPDAIYVAFGAGWDGLDLPGDPEALTGAAIWLARLIVGQLPEEPEPKGLLALMLYCAARSAARCARSLCAAGPAGCKALGPRPGDRGRGTSDPGGPVWPLPARGCHPVGAYSAADHRAAEHTGALRVLYDLPVTQTGGLGAHIGRAVVLAEAGDSDLALAALGALPMNRVACHQPWWVARARVAVLAANPALQKSRLSRAIDLAEDPAVRAFLLGQHLALE